ncbi:MAG: phosphoribosylglycinamide synthetase C domain-containing protein, partial [Candidatus Cloacimonadota bacterium]|nr:phosphoribosylglycinamide synthetase C domain-containing protein [Candidatus Cloacimonadota bacterium]
DFDMEFSDKYFVDVVLVSGGYPKQYEKGKKINSLTGREKLVFHAGTKRINNSWITNSGRVLNVVDTGKTLSEAIENAYEKVKRYHFDNMYYRKDIGKRVLGK